MFLRILTNESTIPELPTLEENTENTETTLFPQVSPGLFDNQENAVICGTVFPDPT